MSNQVQSVSMKLCNNGSGWSVVEQCYICIHSQDILQVYTIWRHHGNSLGLLIVQQEIVIRLL